jgi:hypothetical protein
MYADVEAKSISGRIACNPRVDFFTVTVKFKVEFNQQPRANRSSPQNMHTVSRPSVLIIYMYDM